MPLGGNGPYKAWFSVASYLSAVITPTKNCFTSVKLSASACVFLLFFVCAADRRALLPDVSHGDAQADLGHLLELRVPGADRGTVPGLQLVQQVHHPLEDLRQGTKQTGQPSTNKGDGSRKACCHASQRLKAVRIFLQDRCLSHPPATAKQPHLPLAKQVPFPLGSWFIQLFLRDGPL